MKRIMAVIVSILLLVGLTACGQETNPPADETTPIDFAARYIRTDGYREDIDYPVVKIIRSVTELNAYYEANKELYNLERREDPASDYTVGFLDACDKYDDAYFEEQILVMVLLEEGSGSVRHNVDNVKAGSDGKLSIDVRTIVPEAGTDDMAAWHILIEPEKGVTVASEADVTVFVDGIDPKTQPTTVREAVGFANITLTVPYNWEYTTEREADGNDFCIAFWPAGRSEGKIEVWYYEAFGVCGTGLEQEKITLGTYEAYKSTYDTSKVWDFISLSGTPGQYVVENKGADAWWEEYGEEAMQILGTITVAEHIIGEAEAIAIAEQKATVEYTETSALFDAETGCWTVSLYKKNTKGGDQVLTITSEGKVVDIQYGK